MTRELRGIFVATALGLTLGGGPAKAAELLRPVREVTLKAPSRPKLSRVLEKIQVNRNLIDDELIKKRLTAKEALRLRADLAAIERKTFATAKNGRDLVDARAKSLVWELDAIGRRIRS
ncbi:MAG TPA: hypothetical protein VH309_05930 [Elusimicrobiota bacterium]|jgi:hypothetical protein|nr:hypothetical protein [Elusimicrobiota bacterium]